MSTSYLKALYSLGCLFVFHWLLVLLLLLLLLLPLSPFSSFPFSSFPFPSFSFLLFFDRSSSFFFLAFVSFSSIAPLFLLLSFLLFLPFSDVFLSLLFRGIVCFCSAINKLCIVVGSFIVTATVLNPFTRNALVDYRTNKRSPVGLDSGE